MQRQEALYENVAVDRVALVEVAREEHPILFGAAIAQRERAFIPPRRSAAPARAVEGSSGSPSLAGANGSVLSSPQSSIARRPGGRDH